MANRKKLRKAFAAFNLGDFEQLERMPFIPEWTYFNLNNGIRLDLMDKMKSQEGYLLFDECYQLAAIAEIEGIKVPFLHINHLLANKKAVNRSKDQIDVIYLEKIKKLREEEDSNSNPS